jgi:hypothetical protein
MFAASSPAASAPLLREVSALAEFRETPFVKLDGKGARRWFPAGYTKKPSSIGSELASLHAVFM